jgi:hypothetical protein
MNGRNPSSTYGNITVIALLVAVVGIVVQIFSGVDYPTVPPGIVILLVAAAIVAFAPWRGAPIAGVLVGLFLLVGFAASGALRNLAVMGQPGVLVGTWIQFLAVIAAVVAGLAATTANFKTRAGEAG